VRHDQRKSVGVWRFDMEEMEIEAVNNGPVLTEAIKHRFAASPIVAMQPIIDERSKLGHGHTLRPVSDRFVRRKACMSKACSKVGQHIVLNRESKGPDRVAHGF
jgi:hypothetical protein